MKMEGMEKLFDLLEDLLKVTHSTDWGQTTEIQWKTQQLQASCKPADRWRETYSSKSGDCEQMPLTGTKDQDELLHRDREEVKSYNSLARC